MIQLIHLRVMGYVNGNDVTQVARLTHSISIFTEGMMMMKTTLVGIIKVCYLSSCYFQLLQLEKDICCTVLHCILKICQSVYQLISSPWAVKFSSQHSYVSIFSHVL